MQQQQLNDNGTPPVQSLMHSTDSQHTFIYLFIYYKIVHTVQDRQNGQSNIKSGVKAK